MHCSAMHHGTPGSRGKKKSPNRIKCNKYLPVQVFGVHFCSVELTVLEFGLGFSGNVLQGEALLPYLTITGRWLIDVGYGLKSHLCTPY